MSAMKRAMIAIVSMVILLSGACVIAVEDPHSRGKFWPKGTFRKNLDLKPDGLVSLENGNGNIEIMGWEDEKIAITAERSGEAPGKAGIYFIGSQFSPPDVQVKRAGNSVRIRTGRDGDEGEGEIVHYRLQVPHSVRLDSIRNGQGRISVSNIYGRALLDAEEGEVKVDNFSGSLDVRLGNGSVEAEVLDIRPEDSVRIRVESGDILLRLEPDVAAQLIAEAAAGKILSELELGQPLPAQKVSFRLGEGEASIELTALQGDIVIRKVEKTP